MTHVQFFDYFFNLFWLGLTAYQIIAKESFLRAMVTEHGRGISSKRCIAVSGTATFLYLCIFVTTHVHIVEGKPVQYHLDGNIIIALVTIILTSATIATLPQLLQLFGLIKGVPVPPSQPQADAVKDKE